MRLIVGVSAWLYGPSRLTLGVNELKIKINPTVPFNSVECHSNPFESIRILNPLKNTKGQKLLQVQDAMLAIVEHYRKDIVTTGYNFLH